MTFDYAVQAALDMLGYPAGDDKNTFNAFNAAKDTFNELYYLIHDGLSPEIDSITDEIPLDKRVIDQCFILGTAARIAANYGDTLREEYLAKSYNRRRKRCIRRMVYADVLPTVEEG